MKTKNSNSESTSLFLRKKQKLGHFTVMERMDIQLLVICYTRGLKWATALW
jgi:hypothetical protein